MASKSNWQTIELSLLAEEDSKSLARLISPTLLPGDSVLLHGSIGTGKSTIAREILQSRMAEFGDVEDVPSPTFTLMQHYEIGETDFIHCDLYRLGDVSEIDELGITEAFETAVCLVEWADRLEERTPPSALKICISIGENADARNITLDFPSDRWTDLIQRIRAHFDD